jgi:hypothetical protein
LPSPLIRSATFRSPAGFAPRRDDDIVRGTVQRHLDHIGSGSRALPHDNVFARPVPYALRIDWPEDTNSRLSVIVPTRDSADTVFGLISSLRRDAAVWDRVEVIFIVNGKPGFRFCPVFTAMENTFDRVRLFIVRSILIRPKSTITVCMTAPLQRLLLFMNDDMICLDRLGRSQLVRDEVGVIRGRLLYPNGAMQMQASPSERGL